MISVTGINSKQRRQAIMSLVMLAVLLASVAWAWVLVRRADRLPKRGAEIIAQIRREGLARYWPNELTLRWYLIRTPRGYSGWRAMVQAPVEDGGYSLAWRRGLGSCAPEELIIQGDVEYLAPRAALAVEGSVQGILVVYAPSA